MDIWGANKGSRQKEFEHTLQQKLQDLVWWKTILHRVGLGKICCRIVEKVGGLQLWQKVSESGQSTICGNCAEDLFVPKPLNAKKSESPSKIAPKVPPIMLSSPNQAPMKKGSILTSIPGVLQHPESRSKLPSSRLWSGT